ncbi:XerC Integrase [uncultured Caudovirales phage]|uniref:Integrase n=1 Tax=uncultured Caudovirales phage TaxID=2100421 RepID=A0A6J5LWU4_9CAUD|nr:XerC Integrase [uncultured Caudovirales phage]
MHHSSPQQEDGIPLSPLPAEFLSIHEALSDLLHYRDTFGTNSERMIPNFKPARFFSGGDEPRIEYYVLDPKTNQLVRKKHKLKRIIKQQGKKAERIAADLCAQFNAKLTAGWNPHLEHRGRNHRATWHEAITFYSRHIAALSAESHRTYNSHIRMFGQWLRTTGRLASPISLLRKSDAMEFMQYRLNRYQISARTYNNNCRTLNSIFNYLMEYQYVSTNPFTGIKPMPQREKIRKVIPSPWIHRIITWFEAHVPAMAIVVRMIYYTGMRPTELTRMQRSNLLLDEAIILLRPDQSKNKKSEPVTIPPALLHILRQHFAELPQNYFLFSSPGQFLPGTRQINARKFDKAWTRMRRALNAPQEYQLYSMKDTGIVDFLSENIDPHAVMHQFRHSSLDVTSKYLPLAKPTANPQILVKLPKV